jgi:hypothetical protein
MTPPAGDRWFRVQELVVDLYGAEMGPEAAWIYTCLARYARWDTGECWPSHPTLRAVSGMSLPRIRKALTRLEDLGLIAAEQRRMAVAGVVRWRWVFTLLDPSPAAVMERRRARQTPIAPHHGRMGKPRPPRKASQSDEGTADTDQVFRKQIVQGTESDPEPFGEQFVPDSGNNLCTKQDLRERDADPDPDPRPRPPKGQSGTSPPPAAAALAQGAPLQQAAASAEAGETPALACQQYGCLFSRQSGTLPPAMQEEPVSLHECGWPFSALVVPQRESPAPCTTPVLPAVQSVPAAAAAIHEVPAEPLAAPVQAAASPASPTTRAAPQGLPGGQVVGSRLPGVPAAFGRRYLPAWSERSPEVGHTLPERCRWLLAFPTVMAYGFST